MQNPKLAEEIKKRLIEDDPDSWWANTLNTTPLKEALQHIIDWYDGTADSGPMPDGCLVTLAHYAVTGIRPVDYPWYLKKYPWLGEIHD